MKLHHLGKLAMTTENLPLCSRVRNSRSNVAILPTPQWLLKTPAKFFKERGDSHAAHGKTIATQPQCHNSWFTYY
jgi:hypothetical protein